MDGLSTQAPEPAPMQKSFSTVVPFGFDFDPPRYMDAYAALGVRGGQFYRNADVFSDYAGAVKQAAAYGITFDSMHGLFGIDMHPASPDPAVRQHTLEICEAEGRVAQELGVEGIVVHPCANMPAPADDPFNFPHLTPTEAAALEPTLWRHFDDFAPRLADIGERLGVTYLIENMGLIAPLGHNIPALAQHIAQVGSERIKLCFDTGHAHFTGDMIASLNAAAPVIGYIHLHDNDRLTDNHLMPGDGSIEWDLFAQELEQLQLDVPRMLEVFYPEERIEQLDTEAFSSFCKRSFAL